MTGVSFQVEGVDELRQQFDLLKNTTRKTTIRRALKAGGEKVRAEAERLAPVDEQSDGPHLKDHIELRVRVTPDDQSATVGFGKKVYHGQFQELGTVNHAPQPFLRPAIDAKQGEAVEEIATVLQEEIGKAVRRSRSLR